jgi:hypothetical protein
MTRDELPDTTRNALVNTRARVVVLLRGGLGNQLFLYAFGRYLTLILDRELWLDTTFYLPEFGEIRRFELDHLNIHCQRIVTRSRSFDVTGWQQDLQVSNIGDDREHPFDDVLAMLGNVIVVGEWSAKTRFLFGEELRTLLLRELRPRVTPASATYVAMRDQILQARNPVRVQIRRGDYKSLEHIFRRLDTDYYERAFRAIEARVPDPDYFVFSDDIDDVQRSMTFSREVTYMRLQNPVESLALASLFDHFIAANSTFSWWSAYLGQNPAKTVIFPESYFAKADEQAAYEAGTDYLAPNWIKA